MIFKKYINVKLVVTKGGRDIGKIIFIKTFINADAAASIFCVIF